MTLDDFREKTKDVPGSAKIEIWVLNSPCGMERATIDDISTNDGSVQANAYFLGDDQEF